MISTSKKHYFAAIILVWVTGIALPSWSDVEDDSFPWLATFEIGKFAETFKSNRYVNRSGRKLASLPVGVHSLEKDQTAAPIALIGIHGFGVSGYEWIYPYVTLDTDNIHTFFYRWNALQSSSQTIENLLKGIDNIVENREAPLEKIVILAHSCGGVIATSAIEELPTDVQFDLHTVASPLNGLGLFTVCKPRLPESVPENVTLHQWRTTRVKDSVYWIFSEDPQVVSLEPSSATRLPSYYRGVRLGHVRSLSWVAEQLADSLNKNRATEEIAHSEDL